MSFTFLFFSNYLQSSHIVYICHVCLLVKETAEIETGMAEISSSEQANIGQKLGLVWRNGKKSSQIIIDYFYLPFFLLIILCSLGFIFVSIILRGGANRVYIYIGRDETGSVYLPTQLERTLQLYW